MEAELRRGLQKMREKKKEARNICRVLKAQREVAL